MPSPKQKPVRAASRKSKRRKDDDDASESAKTATRAAPTTTVPPSSAPLVSTGPTHSPAAAAPATESEAGMCRVVAIITMSVIVLVAVLLAMVGLQEPQQHTPGTNACACAAAAHRTLSGPQKSLVGSLLRQREGVNGMQVQTDQTRVQLARWLKAQAPCLRAIELEGPLTTTKALAEALRKPFATATAKHATCVVWFVSEDTISPVANALKELLEKNTLQGDTIVPPGSHGIFLLVSPKDREALKETLPHRVVHMFSPLDFRDAA